MPFAFTGMAAPKSFVTRKLRQAIRDQGEACVRHTAIGLNFTDIHHRTGRYPLPQFPHVIGMEAAGVVEAVGAGVSEVRPGDRVAYASDRPRAYSQATVMPIGRLVKLPDFIDDETAAAVILKGLTAQYLIRSAHPVSAGETILIQAAAGGVGLIMCQWARHLGARVIGTVGTVEKAELAKAHGCETPIVHTHEDVVARVRALTGGAGLPVVYDGVGGNVARLSASPRPVRVVRNGRRADPALRSVPPQPDGFALRDQRRARRLFAYPKRNAGTSRRPVLGSEKRRGAHLDQSALSACRRGARASRPGSPTDRRKLDPAAVNAAIRQACA